MQTKCNFNDCVISFFIWNLAAAFIKQPDQSPYQSLNTANYSTSLFTATLEIVAVLIFFFLAVDSLQPLEEDRKNSQEEWESDSCQSGKMRFIL